MGHNVASGRMVEDEFANLGVGDVLAIIAMENYDAYAGTGFGEGFHFQVEGIEHSNEWEFGSSVAYGSLIAQPSWMSRKRLKFHRGIWLMDLGDVMGWCTVLVSRVGEAST